MTRNEFFALCEDHLIDPNIALENKNIANALFIRASATKIEQILKEEF
jgi:hypothetical protein|tara:strand:+ start:715 stop:858 length:144 start_codon:yes stop_codon:yes gene_type:complete